MFKHLRRFLGQSTVYVGGEFLVRAVSFFLLPIYTRRLTTTDYGILSVVSTVSSVLRPIYLMGLGSAVTRFYFDFEGEKERRDHYGTIWLFLMGATFAATLLFEFVGEPLFRVVLRQTPFNPYIRLAVWTIFLSMASVIPLRLFIVRKKALPYSVLQIATALSSIGLVIYFVIYRGDGALGSLRARFVSALVLGVVYIMLTWREVNPSFSVARLRPALAFGLPLVPHVLAHWALGLSDRLILERFVTLDALGLYSLGYQFGSLIRLLAIAINRATVPFYYEIASTPNGKSVLARFTTYYVAIMTMLALGLALLSREAIVLMADPSYHAAYQVVPLVAAGYLMLALYFVPVNGLFYQKETRVVPLITTLSAAVGIALNLILVPRFGIMAAAFATFVAYFILLTGVLIASMRVFPLPYEFRRLALVLLIALIGFVVGDYLPLNDLFLRILLKTGIVVIGFPAVLYICGFVTDGEIDRVKRFFELLGAHR